MSILVEKKDIEEIRQTNVLPQTPFWGRIKNEQGFKPTGFEIKVPKELLSNLQSPVNVQDDLLVLIRNVNRKDCFAYVPYGPKLEPVIENQGLFLEELSESIRPHLPPNCFFIRYDLKWQNQWALEDEYFDKSGNWLGPPAQRVQELRVNYKTINNNLKKSPGDILPKNTFFLDLTLNEKQLLRNMRYNTRYNIRQAVKKGVQIREYGAEHIRDWYKLYQETAIRHHMPLQDETFTSKQAGADLFRKRNPDLNSFCGAEESILLNKKLSA